jgi:hypothetical protein
MNWNDTTMGKDTGFRIDASKSGPTAIEGTPATGGS